MKLPNQLWEWNMSDSTVNIQKGGGPAAQCLGSLFKGSFSRVEHVLLPFFQSGVLDGQDELSGSLFNQEKDPRRLLRMWKGTSAPM